MRSLDHCGRQSALSKSPQMNDPVKVSTFEDISLILGSVAFEPIEYGERHRMLGEKLGFDVTEILRAIDAIPLCLRGEAHSKARTRLARRIAEVTPEVDKFVDGELRQFFQRLLTPGKHDVMQEFVLPSVERIIGLTIGLPPELPADTLISRLFSQSIGVAKRKRMNAELGALRQRLNRDLPELRPQDIDDRIALCVLGTDALRGTLGCSLQSVFQDGLDERGDRDYMKIPPRTGVPYIDREAMQPCAFAGQKHAAQTILQGRLQALELRSDKERLRFWGFGEHTCLGRRISLQIWRVIAEELLSAGPLVTVLSFTLRKDDVFRIPNDFEIEVAYA